MTDATDYNLLESDVAMESRWIPWLDVFDMAGIMPGMGDGMLQFVIVITFVCVITAVKLYAQLLHQVRLIGIIDSVFKHSRFFS